MAGFRRKRACAQVDSGAREWHGKATETPIGFVPAPDALTLEGLDIPKETMKELLRVDTDDWTAETKETGKFFEQFGNRFPAELHEEHAALGRRLATAASARK